MLGLRVQVGKIVLVVLVCKFGLSLWLAHCSCLYDWWCFGNTCGVNMIFRTDDGWEAKAPCSFRDSLARGYKSNFATCQWEEGSHSTSFASRRCCLIPLWNCNPKVHNHNFQLHICKNLYKLRYVLVKSRARVLLYFLHVFTVFPSHISVSASLAIS